MKRSKQWALYFLIILAISAGLIFTFQKHGQIKQTKKQNIMDSFMKTVYAKNFNAQGELQDTLTSPYVTHFPERNTSFLDTPYLIANNKKGPAWHISALHGKLIDGMNQINLWDQVKLTQPAGPGSHNATLLTNQLTYYPDKKFASTLKPVTILEPGTEIHGIGMHAYMDKQIVHLLHQTVGQYNAAAKKTDNNEQAVKEND